MHASPRRPAIRQVSCPACRNPSCPSSSPTESLDPSTPRLGMERLSITKADKRSACTVTGTMVLSVMGVAATHEAPMWPQRVVLPLTIGWKMNRLLHEWIEGQMDGKTATLIP